MTNIPNFTIRELLDAGVHFGHKTMRWNPKMAPYLYGSRDGIHIIDLQQTAPLLHRSLQAVYDVVKNNGRVLFVGTKNQASEVIAEAAKNCGQYYVNYRWLGGMLTNWGTISQSIKTLNELQQKLDNINSGMTVNLTKKEILEMTRRRDKLDASLGGIKEMGGKPDLLFVIDTNKESLAIKEAEKLSIPIVGVIDSNSDPDGINFPIPGNDDATRAIKLYCRLVSEAALAGIQASLSASGADLGAAAESPSTSKPSSEGIDEEGSEKKTATKKPAAVKKPKTEVTKSKTTAKKNSKPADSAA